VCVCVCVNVSLIDALVLFSDMRLHKFLEVALSIANYQCGMKSERMSMNCVERFRGNVP
jgi:hypothetical protein